MPVETSFPEVLPYSRNASPSLVATFERPRDVCKLLGARFYQQGTGRFISQDPIGVSIAVTNLYNYVKNNPINRIDPSGLIDIPPPAPPMGEWSFATRKRLLRYYNQLLQEGAVPQPLPTYPGRMAIYHTSCLGEPGVPGGVASVWEEEGLSQIDKYYAADSIDIVKRCAKAHEGEHVISCAFCGKLTWGNEVKASATEIKCLNGELSSGEIDILVQATESHLHHTPCPSLLK